MTLFKTKEEEHDFAQFLQLCKQEWGLEHLVLQMPSRWAGDQNKAEPILPYIKKEYCTENEVALVVNYQGLKRLERRTELKPAQVA